jgi:hypothetical protein
MNQRGAEGRAGRTPQLSVSSSCLPSSEDIYEGFAAESNEQEDVADKEV